MNWDSFQTYGNAPDEAFEMLMNQLFDRYLRRQPGKNLQTFRVINSAAGDGGVEAYGQYSTGEIIAVQAKWFRETLKKSQFDQIEGSVDMAMRVRPNISEYIICIPRNVGSKKIGKGDKPTKHDEEQDLEALKAKLNARYSELTITWWLEAEIFDQLSLNGNEGVLKFWFSKEVIDSESLKNQFKLQKSGWLYSRYIPTLHAQGDLQKGIEPLLFKASFRERMLVAIDAYREIIIRLVRAIENFLKVNTDPFVQASLNDLLQSARNINSYLAEAASSLAEVREGYVVPEPKKVDLREVYNYLHLTTETNVVRAARLALLDNLSRVENNEMLLEDYYQELRHVFFQTVRLVLGDAGTGKTHGLANTVEKHLNSGAPAIIIQAFGSPCTNWTEVLQRALESNWTRDEILTALEGLAIRHDHQLVSATAGTTTVPDATTKIVVCVDGLEEATGKETQWYELMRQTGDLVERFPRVRFVFSARRFFYNLNEVPQANWFDVIHLPREGDVLVRDVAADYFREFDIKGVSPITIAGIDNLFALRLFCDINQGKRFENYQAIVTAEEELLNEKIKRVNNEFTKSINKKLSQARCPVRDVLLLLAEHFRKTGAPISHNELADKAASKINGYLTLHEIDLLIDHLCNNGFILKRHAIEKIAGLKQEIVSYAMTFQSILEIIMAFSVTEELVSGQINRLPEQYVSSYPPNAVGKFPEGYFQNKRILLSIARQVFYRTGKIIGVNEYLSDGLDYSSLVNLQLAVFARLTAAQAEPYHEYVKSIFVSGPQLRNLVLLNLILPSSIDRNRYFGAEFLHQILIAQPTPFDRDYIWSGPDKFDMPFQTMDQDILVSEVFFEWQPRVLHLSETALHDETPLVFAWALSSINQALREQLRVALLEWAIVLPGEYLLLLQKLFGCNDPQIQEDLASIALGLARTCKDQQAIGAIAWWAYQEIFQQPDKHRNVIVRQGFRAIAERAYQFGLLTDEIILACRPSRKIVVSLLPLDLSNGNNQQGDRYPIVHDLSWYVIEKAYDEFLNVTPRKNGQQDKESQIDASQLLNLYAAKYHKDQFYGKEWAIAAAIAYMRQLGFSRTEGNHTTEESHGAKSRFFTLEEKYTWLAVHYLNGYLSDLLPYGRTETAFVSDYAEIVHIPNPADSLFRSYFYDTDKRFFSAKPGWVIKETLSAELNADNDIKEELQQWIEKEPNLDFSKWLSFSPEDFSMVSKDGKFVALYNQTNLHDSSDAVYSSLDIHSLVIDKNLLPKLSKALLDDDKDIFFIHHLDGLCATPKTELYANPSDVVWMAWLKEEESYHTLDFGQGEERLWHGITKVHTIDRGIEGHTMVPSKRLRDWMGILFFEQRKLFSKEEQLMGFWHTVNWKTDNEHQELLVVHQERLMKVLDEHGYTIVWFADLFKRKNMLNEHLSDVPHVQRSRKYFITLEGNKYRSFKFWDEHSSNVRRSKK